ncbi:MAG: hypothetical protein PHQ58_17475 [Rhodoferax sp.]|uniref:beta strand repeat-containing protein n=1 Tax=Rhodoferax sp. TaxID=50421 RepID=UPI002631C671|nr:hypothetical protein [Rhodoferax sp.]MDD2882219.1 hypothetical protein [Rhodoferax sp.]
MLAYSGATANAAAKVWLSTITTDASLATAIAPAALTASVASVVAIGADANAGVGGQTFMLTAGVDQGAAFTGGAGNDTFNAAPFVNAAGTTVATLTALDSIDGGAGVNTLNVTDTTAALALPASATVKNIQTANIVAAGTLTGDASGWAGLTKLTATEFGGSAAGALTAAATTAVTLTDAAAAASTISVQGGSNVAVTANGVTAAGTINVGTTTAVAGTLDVTANMLASQTGPKTADAINVKGGTVVTINANLNESATAAATNASTVTGGLIGVTGTAATTTVTVNQTAAATATDAVVAIPFAAAVTGVTAAPGLNGVTAVTGAGAAAVAALAGVVDGKVTIADSTTTAVGSIKTVSLSNYGAASSITSNALTDLSLTGTAGTLTLTRVAALASDTLNLTLNGLSLPVSLGTDNTITDANNEIKTLNVTTATKDSTLKAFADTGLTTLNVAGSNVLTLTTPNASLTKIAVSGAAGFNSDVSALGATLASFTTTSSGKITATLDAATQTFVGSTGQDVITIAADSKKVITGGSGTTDIIVLNNTAATFNATVDKLTTTKVTGFEVLGTSTASQGVFDLSTLPTGLKSIEVFGALAGVTSFTKVTAGSALAIDAAQAAAITYQVADANGTADALSLTLGTAANKAGFITAALTLKDANDVGLGTLNVVSNGSTFNTAHTITALTDNGLSTLNVSGNAGLTITGLNQATTQATGFTINNTATGAAGVTITTLTDANLGTLTFTGTNASEVTTLAGLTGKVLTIANTGTGSATVGVIGDVGGTLQTITLTGNVALGANSLTPATAIGATTGVTVSGATDNAHVNITLTGAAALATDTITLGNGNNVITDNSTAGVVNVTVGSGGNLIDVNAGANNATFAANVTLGAHTNTATVFNKILVSDTGTQATGISATITGAAIGDVLVFTDATDATVLTISAAQQNTITATASLTAAITAAFGMSTAAHQALSFQYGTDTYVISNEGADTAFTAGTDGVIKLVGLHTIADFGTVVGAVAVLS